VPNAEPMIATLNRGTRAPEPYGVHGWLKFLCVWLFSKALAAVVGAAFRLSFESIDPVETVMDVVLSATYGGFATYAAIGLMRIWPTALRVAKAVCFVDFVLALGDCVSAFLDDNPAGTKVGISSSILHGALLAYLYLSDRVRNTYSRAKLEAVSEEFR